MCMYNSTTHENNSHCSQRSYLVIPVYFVANMSNSNAYTISVVSLLKTRISTNKPLINIIVLLFRSNVHVLNTYLTQYMMVHVYLCQGISKILQTGTFQFSFHVFLPLNQCHKHNNLYSMPIVLVLYIRIFFCFQPKMNNEFTKQRNFKHTSQSNKMFDARNCFQFSGIQT